MSIPRSAAVGSIKYCRWLPSEDAKLLELVSQYTSKWVRWHEISAQLPGKQKSFRSLFSYFKNIYK